MGSCMPYFRRRLYRKSNPRPSAALLRYFNPAGSHLSGELGKDLEGIPNNLVLHIADVATGKRPELWVFGDDCETRDGIGTRG